MTRGNGYAAVLGCPDGHVPPLVMLGYPVLPWESDLAFGPSASFAHGVNVDAEIVGTGARI